MTHSEDEIPAVLREFSALGVDVLAINGGDGTTARVFASLLENTPFSEQPGVILLPGGTTNMNVGDVGLKGSLISGVQRIAAWALAGEGNIELQTRPVLRVEGVSDGQVAYGMFFGAGTIISGIEYCAEKIHTRGIRDELAPGLVMLRTIWGLARKEPYFSNPTSMDITLDRQETLQGRPVVQLLITSLQRLFLGLRPYWGQEQGALHSTWMEKPTKNVLRAFPAVIRGKENRHVTPENGYFSHNADQIQLQLDGIFTLDGEMHTASREHGPLRISNGGTVEFLRIGHR
jgi:diacylglycerol kinase (ATP)